MYARITFYHLLFVRLCVCVYHERVSAACGWLGVALALAELHTVGNILSGRWSTFDFVFASSVYSFFLLLPFYSVCLAVSSFVWLFICFVFVFLSSFFYKNLLMNNIDCFVIVCGPYFIMCWKLVGIGYFFYCWKGTRAK